MIKIINVVSHELRDAFRGLSRSRMFALHAVAVFAIGIGVNVGVLSLIDRLLFRPLPYREPTRLVQIHTYLSASPDFTAAQLPYEITLAIEQHSQSFTGLGWVESYVDATIPAPGENPLLLVPTTVNTLELLGVPITNGRGFEPADAQNGAERAVILTHQASVARFGGPRESLGHTWQIGEQHYRVVGILPDGFVLPSSRLLERFDGLLVSRRNRLRPGALTIAPFARLKRDVSLVAAKNELSALVRNQEWTSTVLREQAARQTLRLDVQPLQSGLSVAVRPYVWAITIACWIVLVVATVNLATLLMTRVLARESSTAIRAALGAPPSRLVLAGILEAVLLSGAGGTLAIVICYWTQTALISIVPPTLRGFAVSPLDVRILLLTIVVAAVSAACAAAPHIASALRLDVVRVLQRHGRGVAGRASAWWSLLLGFEAAFAAVLVVAALVTVPKFVGLILASPGFRAEDLFMVQVGHDLDPSRGLGARASAILEVVDALPRVDVAAALTEALPTNPSISQKGFWRQYGVDGVVAGVSDGVFDTLGVPILAGRTFAREEARDDTAVAIVNERGARLLWPNELPNEVIGRSIDASGHVRQVIGVVGNLRAHAGAPSAPGLFLPIGSNAFVESQSALPVIVRMKPGSVLDKTLLAQRLDARLSPGALTVLDVAAEIRPWLAGPRFAAILFGVLAMAALLLVATVLYSVAAVEGRRRSNEMAIRRAFGASAGDIRARILGGVVIPVTVGVSIGLTAVWAASQFVQARVPQTEDLTGSVLAAAWLLVTSTGVLGALRPALRAARVRPASVSHF